MSKHIRGNPGNTDPDDEFPDAFKPEDEKEYLEEDFEDDEEYGEDMEDGDIYGDLDIDDFTDDSNDD